MDEWWKNQLLRQRLDRALGNAGWNGLVIGPFGFRLPTEADDKMTLAAMCAERISRIRADAHGLDIYLCGPAGAIELFVRGDQVGFLPISENDKGCDLQSVREQIGELGDQLRKALME